MMYFLYKQIMINLVVYLAIGFVFSIFIYPSNGTAYEGWLGALLGSFHGSFVAQNWIISLFDPSRSLQAVDHDQWYIVAWWFGLLSIIFNLFKEPVLLFVKLKNIRKENV